MTDQSLTEFTELEQFVAARTALDALRSLSAQLRRADYRAAEAQRNAIPATRDGRRCEVPI